MVRCVFLSILFGKNLLASVRFVICSALILSNSIFFKLYASDKNYLNYISSDIESLSDDKKHDDSDNHLLKQVIFAQDLSGYLEVKKIDDINYINDNNYEQISAYTCIK